MIMENDNTVNTLLRDKCIRRFLILELILYIAFLVLDIVQQVSNLSNVLKYIAIWTCLIFVIWNYKTTKEKNLLFMFVILLFTVTSDTFLLFSNQFEIGILSFIIVQVLYSRKIKAICDDGCRLYMIEMLVIVFVWNILILVLKNEKLLSPTIVLASLYFLIFTGNLIRIWVRVKKNRLENTSERKLQSKSLAIGLTLFYLCDINVGLNFLHQGGIQSIGFNVLTGVSGILMWFFYLPSQVILTLNGVLYKDKIKCKKINNKF